MRKAKLILSGIAAFAVIGGAFAFKASRISKTFYHTTTANGLCTVPVQLFYTPTTTTTATLIPYSTAPTNLAICQTRVLISE